MRVLSGLSLKSVDAIEVRPWRCCRADSDSHQRFAVAENLLDNQFEFVAPNQAWGVDITSAWTNEGGLNLAVVIDS